jgi:hypothetical protein
MTKQKRHAAAHSHKKQECYSSSSESYDSHSDSEYHSDSDSYSSSLSETYASESSCDSSEVSLNKDKRSHEFRKLHHVRTTRGKTRMNKRGSVVGFISMTKEILKIWDKGGFITGKFLNSFVKAYKKVLERKLEMSLIDNTSECNCSIKEATYIVGLAFCMHYNAAGENSETWKIRFHGLLKNVISRNLITLDIVDDIFPLDSSGNYFIDASTNKIIISGKVVANQLKFSDVSGSDIFIPNKLTPPALALLLPGLRDLAVVLETERVLTTNMTLISNKVRAFIDKNVFND